MKQMLSSWAATALMLLSACSLWAKDTIDLMQTWRFALDPNDVGIAQDWYKPGFDDSAWNIIDAGKCWENQGYPNIDGIAWYRKTVFIPEEMRAPRIWLNLGCLNDCGIIYCNGEKIGEFGDEKNITVKAKPIAVSLTNSIRWGENNLIAIRVFDWGATGGPQRAPCNITTNSDALAIHSSLLFAPGFDGEPSVAGLDISFLGGEEENRVRISLQIGEKLPMVKEIQATKDYEGNPIATAAFDVNPKSGDILKITAQVVNGPAKDSDLIWNNTYTWPELPEWPGEFRNLKVLNNFVTELLSVDRVDENNTPYLFLNPRDGWVFFRFTAEKDPVAHLNDNKVQLIWRMHPETGSFEAMQYLPKGNHKVTFEHAKDAHLIIRAVPELAFCYWPTSTALSALPPRDHAFGERYIFPNVNTLITSDNMKKEFFDSWLAEGRHWISSSHVPGLNDDKAPTTDFAYNQWAEKIQKLPNGYAGIIVDEFLVRPPEYYAAWTDALERLYQTPKFEGSTFYAWVTNTYVHEPGLNFMRRLYDLGGCFAWERYLLEQPTEELGLLSIYARIGVQLNDWNDVMPGVQQRTTICFGSFTTPPCSLNINPDINYIPFMETQFHVMATDPSFFNMLGVFQYAAELTDDDVLRYAMKLYRHYGIEGARTRYGDYPYKLSHIANPDFAEGFDAWQTEPAQPGTITHGKLAGLGKTQGRWTNKTNHGDQCAIMVRSNEKPNKLSQAIINLVPGRLYSIKFIAADLDRLNIDQEVGLWPTFEGADIIQERSFRQVISGPYPPGINSPDGRSRAHTTYCHVLIRPRGAAVDLTFSDWHDGEPAGPIGQRIGFNFVEVQPFFIE